MEKRGTRRIKAAALAAIALLWSVFAVAQGAAEASGAVIDIVTPHKGVAVAAPADKTGAVPLFEKASEDSAVLMEYYSGALVEVVSLTGTGMAQVQCGQKGASIMGYMRTKDLRYGEQAMREVPLCLMHIEMNSDVAVQNFRDELAVELARIDATNSVYAISRSDDKWVQLYVEPCAFSEERDGFNGPFSSGFVQLQTGVARAWFEEQRTYRVLPVEGEMTYEQAYERAIELVLEHEEEIARDFPNGLTREELMAMNAQWWLYYDADEKTVKWIAAFYDPQDIERDVSVDIEPDGAFISITLPNG